MCRLLPLKQTPQENLWAKYFTKWWEKQSTAWVGKIIFSCVIYFAGWAIAQPVHELVTSLPNGMTKCIVGLTPSSVLPLLFLGHRHGLNPPSVETSTSHDVPNFSTNMIRRVCES